MDPLNIFKEYSMSLSEAKKQIKPMDLILFRAGEIISNTIRFIEYIGAASNDWSHVGLIVNTDIIPSIKNAQPGHLYVWESTLTGNVNDVESDGSVFGVQIRPLDALVAEYNKDYTNSAVAWTKLENNPCERRDSEGIEEYELRITKLRKILCELHQKFYHETYELNILKLLSAVFPCLRQFRDIIDIGQEWKFCSELVATIYCSIGVLNPEQVDPENVLPLP